MQLISTMRYYFTLARMAIINKLTNKRSCKVYVEKGTLVHHWWECRLVQSLWKAVWRYLKKLTMDLLYDPEIPLVGIYL